MIGIDAAIYNQLCDHLGTKSLKLTPVSGGSINEAFKVSTTDTWLFCKINSATKFLHLFNKEAAGLSLIEKQGLLRHQRLLQRSRRIPIKSLYWSG